MGGGQNRWRANIRVAPADRPLRTSEYPVITPARASRLRPPLKLTLSKISVVSAPGKVNRKIAAWSVGAISVCTPLRNFTP